MLTVDGTLCVDFYDASGRINDDVVARVCAMGPKRLVGWFRCGQRALTRVTVREMAVHRSLQDWVQRVGSSVCAVRASELLFVRCGVHRASSAAAPTVQSMDYRCMQLRLLDTEPVRVFRVPVTIRNLQHSSADEFGELGRHAPVDLLLDDGDDVIQCTASPNVAKLLRSSLNQLQAELQQIKQLKAEQKLLIEQQENKNRNNR